MFIGYRKLLLSLPLICLVVGCTSAHLVSQIKEPTSFGKVSSFAVARVHTGTGFGTLAAFSGERFLNQFEAGLTGLGLPVNKSAPDLIFSVALSDAPQEGVYSPEELRFNKGAVGSNFPDANPRSRRMMEFDIVVTAYPALKNGKPVWEGRYGPIGDPELQNDGTLASIARKLASQFMRDRKS